MKRISVVWAGALAVVLVLGGFVPLIGTVMAAIPIPHNMYGHPYDETGVKMPVNELITSWVDGVEYGRNLTFSAVSDIWYDIDTAGNWMLDPVTPETPWEREGADLNDPIMYVWGDMTNIKLDPEGDLLLNYGVFNETDLWMTNVTVNSDLHLPFIYDQPPLFPKISMIIPAPTDGWGDYVLIYTEDPFVDMSAFYLEKNDGTLVGPSEPLSGVSNTTAYFYANLTTLDLNACGDELKLVWTNPGPAFGGNDIVVDRVEWNATTGGVHGPEPDNTIMTDASAPACGTPDFALRRQGVFPVFDQDTNDNAADFVVDTPWPRPIIGAPVMTWISPTGGERWTGGMDHEIIFNTIDANYLNNIIDFWVNYSLLDGVPGSWVEAQLSDWATGPVPSPHPFRGKTNPMNYTWTLPAADTDVARLEVCAVNPAGKSSCSISNAFTIDSTPPTVDLTDPGNAEVNVSLDKPINITFSECMNTASVDLTNLTIQPALAGATFTWTGCDFLSIQHNDFQPDTRYWVNISGSTDDSDPGNPIDPYSFYFDTYIPQGPTVDVTYPVGGEIWSGGKQHTVYFNATHPPGLDITYIWLNLTYDTSTYAIVEGYTDPDVLPPSYTFTLPSVDASNCQINATIQDLDDGLVDYDLSGIFTCDSTPPEVVYNVPTDGETNVTTDIVINVTFSEPMDRLSVDVWLRTAAGDTINGTISWSDDMNVDFTPYASLDPWTDYTVVINSTAMDQSDPGNNMAADHIFTFKTEHTPYPTVEVTKPTEGEVLKGQSPYLVTWTMGDVNTAIENLSVDVYYTYGTTITAIAADLTGNVNYSWTVACPAGTGQDYPGVTITVNVTDEEGQTSSNSSGAFTIDCTKPTGQIDSVDSAVEDTEVDFSVIGASSDVTGYSWDFGDGETSTLPAPTHVFEEPRTYTVTLTLTDAVGWESDPITKQIEIQKKEEVGLGVWLWVIVVIIIVVIIAILAALLAKRRKKPVEEIPEEEIPAEEVTPEEEVVEEGVAEEAPAEEEAEEPVAPEAAPAEPTPAAAPAEEKPAGETKECPSCGTVVPADATECFLCGAKL